MQRIHGYGFLSSFNPGFDLPYLPSREEWHDGAMWRGLTYRWRQDLEALPAGAPVPAERAWRVAREYHDYDHVAWAFLVHNLTTYHSLARAHGCHVPLVALVREPHQFYVSHHTWMTGRFFSTIDAANPGSRPNALLHTLSMEGYTRAVPDLQSRYLTGRLYSRKHMTLEEMVHWVRGRIDVLGTTERMGDFVRATCHAAGIPHWLCLSEITPENGSDSYCFRGLRNALRANDTRVLFPDGPAESEAQVRLLCADPRGLYKRIAGSEAMRDVVRQAAALDLALYAMAAEAIANWRANAPAEWLAPSLGGDRLPRDRYTWAMVPIKADVRANASVLRVGQLCRKGRYAKINMERWKMSKAGNDNRCVLLEMGGGA